MSYLREDTQGLSPRALQHLDDGEEEDAEQRQKQ